ncbi:hypothetical protein AWB78_00866 [Caballeronia calidae]|uniref:Uncharacterized protein n=1 Tax=Caballeronia calidae TaxID=1777139 RepID=A0A157ZS55_9BURK|nr:hypothetical protein [Caballeronia calidae]SAK48289.1 hypothetical protein AWB78_00866 [Caballeronia calidae]
MTSTTVDTISAADAAFMLRAYLGTLRSWADFLSDCIRSKQDIAGHTLMPCAERYYRGLYRPVYAVSDVKAFIEKVQIAIPSAGKTPIKTTALAIDPTKRWDANKFDCDGAPVARRSRVSTRYAHATRSHIIH